MGLFVEGWTSERFAIEYAGSLPQSVVCLQEIEMQCFAYLRGHLGSMPRPNLKPMQKMSIKSPLQIEEGN